MNFTFPEVLVIMDSALPTGLAHISLAVDDAEAEAKRFETLFGARIRKREILEERGLRIVFLDVAGIPIELIEPLQPGDAGNTVASFLRKRGPGLHHVAFFVADAQAALDRARAAGADLVDEKPRPGADGCRVAFLHPRSTAGALIEYVEREEIGTGES